MDADWITSPSARRVLQHTGDSRPAWLWSQDGLRLLWQNAAADLFQAKVKKHGVKLAPAAVPIKGQVARNIRLGSTSRTSLARIQFLAGEKPVSATCATTPLTWQNGQTALLIVAVDPIPDDVQAAFGDSTEDMSGVDELIESSASDEEALVADTESDRHEEAPQPLAPITAERTEDEELANWQASESETVTGPVLVPRDDSPAEPPAPEPEEPAAPAPEPEAPLAPPKSAASRLTMLVDRLASDEALFSPLTDEDDTPPQSLTSEEDAVAEPEAVPPAQEPTAPEPEPDAEPTPDAEVVERVSRYNFDELSRILNDRVGDAGGLARRQPTPVAPSPTSSLVNLGGETLVLNRLPLGILVFRDQQILFANRAITEMVGYDSVESLRQAGLAAVFPAAGPEGDEAGPVNHLMQRDGTLVPVTARLQSMSWQGRPALMLSASATEVRTSHEAAVGAFAMMLAETRGDGFLQANRAGVIENANGRADALLGTVQKLAGRPLSALLADSDLPALREFLERPARFAETERPHLTLRDGTGKSDITLFAQGQAGVVTGYFALVRPRSAVPVRASSSNDLDPALLARISRSIRRPLNSIIGFAELLRASGSEQNNERHDSYTSDIAAAGRDIAALVDELEDYARLREGRYLPQRAAVDLTELLESCVIRIRKQANLSRVIVRNAISENLPRVTADRPSLTQAILNLLASAIDQTPSGGAVIISAQREDDGAVAIHVRDSSDAVVDMAERFVVFRDGAGRDGQVQTPLRSSLGLAMTRSLLAVNAFNLSVDPAGEQGMLFTLVIPADLVERGATPKTAE